MGDVVNLNAFRKRQEREAIKDKAAENRARHGRKRITKRQERQDQERAEAQLNDKKLTADAPSTSSDTPKDPKRGA